ncbi:MAG: hypothetical protein M1371_00440 [Actinobacteria bacterium]|nr:hypothetical protein [Actinomycetota bacterium]
MRKINKVNKEKAAFRKKKAVIFKRIQKIAREAHTEDWDTLKAIQETREEN